MMKELITPLPTTVLAHTLRDCLALTELTDPAYCQTSPVLTEPTFCFSCKRFAEFCKEMY